MYELGPSEFYKNKTALVTGGTGLVGQLLIEKLIRLDARKIFIIVREKKGVSAEERTQKLLGTPIFESYLQNENLNNNIQNKLIQKVILIEGDLAREGLGLNENDTNLLIEETELIFHSAAHVRFDECLRDCITINVKGTKELLQLSEKMSKLLSFVYVSTAFCQIHHKVVEEKFYPPPIDPEIMIKSLDLFESEEIMDIFTQKIISPLVNSYTFSKALAEDLIKSYSSTIPVCVVRPSIILTTYREPIPGFTSNLYGISGIICGVGIGVLRVANIGPETLSDIIPADYVTNFILLSAWKRSQRDTNSRELIFNCCASENSVFNKYVGDKSVEIGKTMPLKRSLWKICYTAYNFHGFFFIFELFYHILPAFIFDFMLFLQLKNPKVVKIYRKIAKFQSAVGSFFNIDYKFSNKKMTTLIDEIPEKEKFECDIRKVVWDDFWPSYIRGLRRYMMKEDDDTIPEALSRHHKITIVHNLMLVLIYCTILYVILKIVF
uniref:Fatty acyl-CoA reductase n=1 Tax=Culicoides sonorensis TaxID=179676 RepID=A0A336K3G5_CULSO